MEMRGKLYRSYAGITSWDTGQAERGTEPACAKAAADEAHLR